MKKRLVNKLITILQVFLLTIPIVLQYLSYEKMGVNRYLVFKKMIFSKEVFAIKLVIMLKVILIIGFIIGVGILIYYFIKKLNKSLVKTIIKIIILNFISICFVFSKQFEAILSYHFFLVAIFIIIILQYLKAILNLPNITWKII